MLERPHKELGGEPIRMPHRYLQLSPVALCLMLSVSIAVEQSVLAQPSPRPVFPGATWEMLTPERAGLDAAKLQAAIAKSPANAGCVIRYGYMVTRWGSLDDFRRNAPR